ncbi:hypothetical protein NDU88_000382 [Pleurodeles waltl]|uniref:Uncharacterized protein n=1 Tax=Pleurodeles waltl TaxID=8319 RepID=A0AAV7VXD3_PLEWA|nr:hypothetical protein NDU88_000382 [Pleurodeles waltl]
MRSDHKLLHCFSGEIAALEERSNLRNTGCRNIASAVGFGTLNTAYDYILETARGDEILKLWYSSGPDVTVPQRMEESENNGQKDKSETIARAMVHSYLVWLTLEGISQEKGAPSFTSTPRWQCLLLFEHLTRNILLL